MVLPVSVLKNSVSKLFGSVRTTRRPSPRGATADNLRAIVSEGWAHQDSNLEQAGYEPAALTVELWARTILRRPSFEERAKLARPRRMPKLAQGLGFDLPDPLARDREALSDFLERVLAAVADAEPHLDHL